MWAPAQGFLERIRFPQIRTYDSFRAPEDDDEPPEPIALADVDLAAIGSEIASEAPGKPQERRPGPATQRSTDQLAAARAQNVELVAANRELGKRLAAAEHRIRDLLRVADHAVRALTDASAAAADAAKADEHVNGVERIKAAAHSSRKDEVSRVRQTAPAVAGDEDPLVAAARSVWPVRLTWGQLTTMCGRKARGGHFNRTRKALVDAGVVREVNGKVELADPPTQDSGDWIPADVLEERLPSIAADMFRAIRRNPGLFDWQGLGNHLGRVARGGHWNKHAAILRSNGLVLEEAGALRIAPELEAVS